LPGILSDIDGVVYRGGREIGNSRKVIDFLLNRTFHDGKHIPFALLTNGGGISEDERAKYIAHVIGLDKKNSGKSLEGSDPAVKC
jgi:ribonucleotide monophosphatase NagD (HAD superfamily)